MHPYNAQTGKEFVSFYSSSSSYDRTPTSVCELPSSLLSPHFTGRNDELQEIEHRFNTSSIDQPGRCIIHGMPGLGKTQLALKFATLAFQKGQHPYVFWVSAVSVEKLTRGLSKLADLVRLPGRQTLDQASRLTVVRAWLEDQTAAKSWLVVLDNVSEETAVMLRDALPRKNHRGRLLMTTRTAKIAAVFGALGESSQLALQPLKLGDAIAMLVAGANKERENGQEVSHTDAEHLVRLVGNLPLAIDQAASFMRETGSGLREVLDMYKSDEVSEILSWENDLSRHEEKSVVATFTPALNQIQQTAPDAVTLLRVLSFCDPEGIPIEILVQGCNALRQEDVYKSSKEQAVDKLKAVVDLFQSPIRLSIAIQKIQRLSLAAQVLDGSDRIIRIHDLVHLLLRLKSMTDKEQKEWLEIAIYVVCKAFEEIGDRRSPYNWNRCGQFVSHIESLESFAEQNSLHNTELLDASTWAAVYLEECGLYEKAITLNKKTLNQKKRIFGERHPSTLTSMNNLAEVLEHQGKYKEAEGIDRQTLALWQSVLGKKHPSTLRSMNNLALVLEKQGKYKEAEDIHQRTLALSESTLGNRHPETLASINNLASVLRSQGKYKEAEGMHRQALALRESVLGKKHPHTLMSINNLASVLRSQGKYKEAEGMHRQALALRESVLGKKHPSTLMSINNLAEVLERQGNYQEAEGMHRQTLALKESVLGKEHPDTLTSMNNLALVLQSQGKYKEAEDIYRQTLVLRESMLGKEHPDTLTSINNLASVLQSQGKYEEAEDIHRQTLVLRESMLGKEHPDTLLSMDDLALVLGDLGRYAEAEDIHRQTLTLRESVLGKEHPSTLTSKNNLALILKSQGKYEEAEDIHRQTLALRELMLGKEHPDTLMSMNNLALVLRGLGRYAEVEDIHRQILALRELVLGKEHSDTISAMSNLAITLEELGRIEEAGKMKEEVLEKRGRIQSETHQEAFSYVDSAYGTASHGRQDGNNAYRPGDSDSTNQDTYDARSEYSVLSTNNSAMLTYVQDFANDLFSAIYTFGTDPKHLQRLCETLKGLLGQFAFRISYEMQSKEGQEIMYYMHQNRGLIVDFFQHLTPNGYENQENSAPAHFDRTSVQRKVWDWVNEEEPDNVLIEEPSIEISEEQDLSCDSPEDPIDRYRTLIIKTSAYQWLLSVMRRELTLVVEQEDILGNIHREISKVLPPVPKFSNRRQPDAIKLLYVLKWNPETFISGQEYAEERTVAMERAITLTGTLTNAQALPCIQYLRQMWPTNGERILRLMQQLLESKCGDVIRVNDRRDRSEINAWKTLSAVYVEVCGSRSSIIEIGEQLAWFGGTMRPSPFAGVALSLPYVDTYDLTREEQDGLKHLDSQDNSTVLKINFALSEENADPERYTEGRCWHNLFRNPVVVQGFPILERYSLSNGLEIPLNIMAALVGTTRAHIFDDTTILKGFSSMLVPIKRSENLTTWHVVFHADGTHVSYTERGLSSLRSTNFAELQTSRHIVGWCPRARGCAGRPEASYSVARSNLKKVGSGCLLEKASISLGKYVTAGMNVALAVKDIPVHISRKPYVQKLRQLYDKFFVFWDTEDKRGWLVNGLDALLHLVRATLKHYEKDKLMKLVILLKSEDISEPSKEQAGELDIAYAFNILRAEENMKLPVYADKDTLESGNADEYGSGFTPPLNREKRFVRLEDRVDELYEALEKIVAHQEEKAGQAGVKINAHVRKHLEGWQFQDLASDKDPMVPYVENIEAIGKGWVDFVRSIGAITLFGRGFGHLIQPLDKTGCPRWEEVPKKKFYLAARVADLQHIIDTNSGNDTANPIEVCDGISWFSPDSPFDACPCTRGQILRHSDPVQVLWPTQWITRLPSRKRIPLYPGGAVIFGYNVKFKWIWGDIGEPVKGDPSLESADNPMSSRDDGTSSTEHSNSLHHNPSTMTHINTPVTSIHSMPEQERDPEEIPLGVDEQTDHENTESSKTKNPEGIHSAASVRSISKRSGLLRRLRDKLSK